MKVRLRLDFLTEGYRAQVGALADQWRTEILVPFCSRRKLEFRSGNGTWLFTKSQNHRVDLTPETAPRGWCEEFQAIENVLRYEVGTMGHDLFGFYVRDVL